MTAADFEAALGAFLVDQWLERIGWTRETIRGFFEHGIPVEYARSIADALGPDFPVSLWPKLLHPPKVLHKRLRPSSVNEPTMDKEHRLAISEGHKGSDDAFMKAIRAKGFSQNTLAKRVGLNRAVLSLHRSSLRRIKRSKAEAIEKLTGWPADSKHWPCGIVPDGE